jgi:hypothetical protein
MSLDTGSATRTRLSDSRVLSGGENDHFLSFPRKFRVQILVCACPHYIIVHLSAALISRRQQFGLRLTVDRWGNQGQPLPCKEA